MADIKEAIKRPDIPESTDISVYAAAQLKAIYDNKSSDEYKSHGDIKKSNQYSNITMLVNETKTLQGYPKEQARDILTIYNTLHNPIWNKMVTAYIAEPNAENSVYTLTYTVGFRMMVGELGRVFTSTEATENGIVYNDSKVKADEENLKFIHYFSEDIIKKLGDYSEKIISKNTTVQKEAFEMLEAFVESGIFAEETYTSMFLEGAGTCPECGKEPCVCGECGDVKAVEEASCPKCGKEPCICSECGDDLNKQECGDGTTPPDVKQESAEVLYEAVTGEKVDAVIANALNGMKQIVEGIGSGWTQHQFKKFWSSTQEGNFMIGTKWTIDGEKFKKVIKKLMRYLSRGANKGVFGDKEGADAEEARKCYDKVFAMYKACNGAAHGKVALDKLGSYIKEAQEAIGAIRSKIGNATISEYYVESADYMFEFEYEDVDDNDEVVTEAVLNLSGVVDIASDVFRVFTKTFSAVFRSVKELRPKSFVNACLTKSYEKKVDKFADAATMYSEAKKAYDEYMKLPAARRKEKTEHKYAKMIDKYNIKMQNCKAKIAHYDQRSLEETMDEAKKVMEKVESTPVPQPTSAPEATGTDVNDAPTNNAPAEDLGF